MEIVRKVTEYDHRCPLDIGLTRTTEGDVPGDISLDHQARLLGLRHGSVNCDANERPP